MKMKNQVNKNKKEFGKFKWFTEANIFIPYNKMLFQLLTV